MALTAAAEVASRRFKKWSQEQKLFNPHDTIVSGQLGYLCDEHLELRWNLASADERPKVIDGIVDAIEKIAFPFFDRFTDFHKLRCDLQTGTVPMMYTTDAIHFLMCFGTRDEAVAAGKHFMINRPDLNDDYRNELSQLESREPLQIQGLGWAKELAIVSHFFGLGDLTEP